MKVRHLAIVGLPLAFTQCAPTCAPPPPAPPSTTVVAPTTTVAPEECLDPATMLFADEHVGEFGQPIFVWYGLGGNGPRPMGHSDSRTSCINSY